MKNLYILLLIFLNIQNLYSQNNFEFIRSWGTYYGPIGSGSSITFKDDNILRFDVNDNPHVVNGVINSGNTTVTYFNNFILNSTSPLSFIYTGNSTNLAEAKFNPSGNLSSYSYTGLMNPATSYSKKLSYIDQDGNKYYQFLTLTNSNLPVSPTTGAPWTTYFYAYEKLILAKYNTYNQLVWATFLPCPPHNLYVNIEVDQDQNVYISGSTYEQQNITTTGTFSPSYIPMYDSANQIIWNGFLVKLNSQGQKQWGTYLPNTPTKIKFVNNQIFTLLYVKTFNYSINITTPGAHQSTKADSAILSIDATTGQLTWGTYYGPPTNSDTYNIRQIDVSEGGLYVTGDDLSPVNYFGTPGTFKPQKTSNREVFLSKFDLSGNLLWSSYFGGTGSGITYCSIDKPLALIGDEAFICGNLLGEVSNIATAGAYQTTPNLNNSASNNFFFAKFLSNGQLGWASYYGGTNNWGSGPTGYFQSINLTTHKSSLYLYGSTNSDNGYASNNAWLNQPNVPSGLSFTYIGFMAKFDLKTLSTHENDVEQSITLYDNPNNGNFTITGQILGKGNNTVSIYDTSGRLIHVENFSKTTKKAFNLHSKLNSGQYTLELKQNNQPLKTFKIVVKK